MKVVFAILWWLTTAITAFLAVLGGVALFSGQVMPLVCFLLVFALPPIQPIAGTVRFLIS